MKKLPAALKAHEFKKGAKIPHSSGKMHPDHAHVGKVSSALHGSDPYKHEK